MNLRQTDKAAGVKRGRVRLPSVRPSTHLSASSHWRRALMSAFSTYSNRLVPSGILMRLSAPCGGEDTSAFNPPTGGGGDRGRATFTHTHFLSFFSHLRGHADADAAARTRWWDGHLDPSTV